MRDAVIVNPYPHRPPGALAGDPVGSISPSLPDKVVRRHAR